MHANSVTLRITKDVRNACLKERGNVKSKTLLTSLVVLQKRKLNTGITSKQMLNKILKMNMLKSNLIGQIWLQQECLTTNNTISLTVVCTMNCTKTMKT